MAVNGRQFIGAGVELASFTLAGTLVGFGIDRATGRPGPGIGILTLVGFAGGMYRFIRAVQSHDS
ncbi:MAG: AtpZ/AtpI family protein [Planctomycetota bacterium]